MKPILTTNEDNKMKEQILDKVIDVLGGIMLEEQGNFWVSAAGGTLNVASGVISKSLCMDYELVRDKIWYHLEGVFQECFSSSQSADWDLFNIDIKDLAIKSLSIVRFNQSN